MKKINIAKVPMREYKSPKGKFGVFFQDTSQAIGRRGVPFELELVTVKPGKANFPYHLHTAEHEMYVVSAGRGQLRTRAGKQPLRTGDVVIFPPNEPHQIINNSARDLKYYVIANNQCCDCCYYPDSRKWAIPGKVVKVKKVPYHEGEE
jgi:uncharacterized cupin superfamily protein